MSDANNTRDRLIAEFTENYMEKLFYFCLKKTGKSHDADDLTQDIALNVIKALQGGTVPTAFSAWVWRIARNRYAVWAGKKHRRNESVTGYDIGDYEIEDESGSILDEMIRSEELSLLWRELAFIRSDYRDIVVAYYIKNKSIRDIASKLSLSTNAVQQRLRRARTVLKEGMDMARKFGKRSYDPEQINFVMSGRDGKEGQPWSIITHLLYKNIFLETYENPETAEELALELGIALPYMEDELEYLVQQELLRKSGNKYETNFHIVSRDEQRETHDLSKKIQKPLTHKICALIDAYMKGDGAKANVSYVGYETAKWALLMRTFDSLGWKAKEISGESDEIIPDRPDDGAWVLTGYETIDWEKPDFVGLHGCFSHGENGVKQDIDFGQFKFFINNHHVRTPEQLTLTEAYTLWLACTGKIGECEQFWLEKLLEYGYLKENSGAIEPNVVIFDRNAASGNNAELTAELSALKNEIVDMLIAAPKITRGYVVEQALEDGWLKYDENTIDTIGAFIYL